MSTTRSVARGSAMAATLGLITVVGAGTASAHVKADPKEATKGEYAKIAFRVPNERPTTGTVKIKVTLPLDHPLSSVHTKPVPGWTSEIQKVHLDKPVEVAGAQVTDAVSTITWTAQPGTRIAPDQFEEFEANLGTLPTDVDQLVMPTEQTYDNGEVVNWDAPQPEGAPEPDHPAPKVKLVDEQGDDAPEASAETTPPTASSDNTARLLGGAGLIVGAFGLGIGGGALVLARGRRPRNERHNTNEQDES